MRRFPLGFVLVFLLFHVFSDAHQTDSSAVRAATDQESQVIGTIEHAQKAIEIATLDDITRIGNSDLSLLWNSTDKTVCIDQDGLYVKIVVPEAHSSMIVRHAAPGRDGKMLAAASLVLQDADEDVQSVYTITEQNPFVVVSKLFSPKMFKDGPLNRLDFPEIELLLPESTDQLTTLGTAGLRPVDDERLGCQGSYMFLAVANPAVDPVKGRSGVVAGFLTSNKGSGIVQSAKNADGKVVLKPFVEYGKLLEIENPTDYRDNLSETFVVGRFADCRRGLERYAWQIARTHQIRMKEMPVGFCGRDAAESDGVEAATETSIKTAISGLIKNAEEKLVPYGFNAVVFFAAYELNGPNQNSPVSPEFAEWIQPASMIRDRSLRAGLGFWPFSGNKNKSSWNKDWFVKSGETVSELGNSNKAGEPYATYGIGDSLDLTRSDVQQYLHDEVDRIANQWRFNFFELGGLRAGLATQKPSGDGNYCPDDLGKAVFFDSTVTPIAAYRKGLKIVREAAGEDCFILADAFSDSRTLVASIGLVDAMHITPKSANDGMLLLNSSAWARRSVWSSNQYFFNGRVWWNDPGLVCVNEALPLEQARMLASWIAVSGQLFTSFDWLPDLADDRLEILRRTIRPHGLRSARPVDLFNEDLPQIWHLTTRTNRPLPDGVVPDQSRDIVALYNWDDKETKTIEATPQWIGLPEAKEYVAYDFWGKKLIGPFSDKLSVEVPPVSCVILAVRPVEKHPILLSTSQHVTQGIVDVLEEFWDPDTKTLSGASRVVADDPYELRIYDPSKKELRVEVLTSSETIDNYPWNFQF